MANDRNAGQPPADDLKSYYDRLTSRFTRRELEEMNWSALNPFAPTRPRAKADDPFDPAIGLTSGPLIGAGAATNEDEAGGEDAALADSVIGGLGPETEVLHPSPVLRVYSHARPDGPNPETLAHHPAVPATTHGYGSRLRYRDHIIETYP